MVSALFYVKTHRIIRRYIPWADLRQMTGSTSITLFNPYTYKTNLGSSGTERFEYFDKTYKAYLENRKMGKVTIVYNENIEDYLLEVEFKHAGKTKLILESPDKEKKEYKLDVRFTKYDIEKIKQ